MTLIKSISGIRGTIGGKPGEGLTPVDLLELTSAYALLLKQEVARPKVVIGRDGRDSGRSVQHIISGVLSLSGCDVISLDLTTTPTVEMAVPFHQAQGGIILTASHNPAEWNALKFLDHRGEFISADKGQQLLEIIDRGNFVFADHKDIGVITQDQNALQRHIRSILELSCINVEKIRQQGYKVVIDAINSTGALAIPPLLDALGVKYRVINGEVNGKFAHDPEPLPSNLEDLQKMVREKKCDLGIAVDPDVDRLAFFGPEGQYFGEEYTLVAAADHVLSNNKGNTVSNLSSTRALTDLSDQYGVKHHQSAVGEVNVVRMMKETNAVIGGEGNGGVILPELHYGRDALVGIALVLSLLAERNTDLNTLRKSYTSYEMVKEKLPLTGGVDPEDILEKVHDKFISSNEVSTIDGVKVYFENGWVHLRRSNTEPIMRVYAEGRNEQEARQYAEKVSNLIDNI